MANITTQEMLNDINAAITAIAVGGQSYKIGSRSLTRADLKQLCNPERPDGTVGGRKFRRIVR